MREQRFDKNLEVIPSVGSLRVVVNNSHSKDAGRCSSVVEQRFCKPLAGGSNPFTGFTCQLPSTSAFPAFRGPFECLSTSTRFDDGHSINVTIRSMPLSYQLNLPE